MTNTVLSEHDRVMTGPREAPTRENPPPRVSIVMANFNGARTIEAALRSAQSQSLNDIEIIVADDASTDDSAGRVAAVASRDPRVRLLRAPVNAGPGATRNLCLDAARGRWIAVMDSDDLMHPRRLEQLVAEAERDGAGIVADDLLIFHDDPAIPPTTCLRGHDTESAFWVDAADYVRANTLFSGARSLGYLKPLIRASLIEDHALRYDTTLRIAEDFDFILRLLRAGARFRVYPEPRYFYRKHVGSISHRLSRQTLEPMLAAHDRCANGEDATFNAAMLQRRVSLRRALDFDDLVSALKRRDWRAAATLVVRRPRVAAQLRGPLLDRLRRFASKRSAPPPAPRPQVCVLSRKRIIGNTNGSSVYLLSICTALHQSGCDVHLLWPSPSVFGRWPALLLKPEMSVFRSIKLRGSIRIGRLLIATDPATIWRAAVGVVGKALSRLGCPAGRLDQRAPYSISQDWTRRDALFVARNTPGRADVVVADYAFQTYGIPYTLSPDAISFVVMHDLFSSRSAQFDRLGAIDSVTALDQPAEMALLRQADVVVAIQAEEAAVVRQCLPGQRVVVAPIAITPVEKPHPGGGRSVLFVGSNTAPNVFGLRWFLETVWPVVRSAVPDATLLVAGSVRAGMGPPSDGVRLLGMVADLAALYGSSAVVISPLLAGSGLKIKLIEALGFGKAIVATSVTLQGVEEAVGGAVRVADDFADFAAAVIELLTDEALRMARATTALEVARARFSPAACYAELLTLAASANARCSGFDV